MTSSMVIRRGGRAYSRGEYRQAIRIYEAFLARSPNANDRGKVLFELAKAHEKQGSLSDARSVYLRLIRLKGPLAKQARKRLDGLSDKRR